MARASKKKETAKGATIATLEAEITALKNAWKEKEADHERQLQAERSARQQRETDMREQITAAEAQVAAAHQASAQQATPTVAPAAAIPSQPIPGSNRPSLIPRPKGKLTEVWKTLRVHGIDNDEYKAIHDYVKELISPMSGINWSKPYRDQDPTVILHIVSAATEAFPVLNKFDKRWPALHFIQQFMGNHRGTLRDNGGLPPAQPRNVTTTEAERKEQARVAVKKANDNKKERLLAQTVDENIDPAL